jgi:hypothetical protein
MIAQYAALSAWSQSTLVGVAFVPIIFLATAALVHVAEKFFEPQQHTYYLRLTILLVVVVGFGAVLLAPVWLHLSLTQPDFDWRRLDRLALPWIVLWTAVSLAPILVYAAFSKKPHRRFRFALQRGVRLSLWLMLVSAFWSAPVFAFSLAGWWELDLARVRLMLFGVPYAAFIIFFLATLVLADSQPEKHPENQPADLVHGPLFYLCSMLSYAAAVALYSFDLHG